MARGLPDWTQEFKPHLGKTQTYSHTRNHPGMELYTMFTVTGKGVIHGGYLQHSGAVPQHSSCAVILTIDTIQLNFLSFRDMEQRLLGSPHSYPIHLLSYDPVLCAYRVSFRQNWTFDQSYQVAINEQEGAATSSMQLFYSLFI